MLTEILKQDGRREIFSPDKIKRSIWLAMTKTGGKDKKLADQISKEVTDVYKEKLKKEENISTLEVGETVERLLIEKGQVKAAQEFIRCRENKKHYHQKKETLGVKDDVGLSYNTLYILKSRYLKRNESGEIIETPREMIERVAYHLSKAEIDRKKQQIWYKKFFEVMISFEFLPGTRPLANSGKKAAQLGNCFVWPIEDDIDQIFDILHKSTLIKKHGGGCGYNFSNLRPQGDVVGGIPDLAAGSVKMIEMFDLMTSLFKQEGKYESGNMAVLNADHPDIFNFISAKQNDGYLSKTNLSVGITDKFMNAAIKGEDWDLINPRTSKTVDRVEAKTILSLMARMAWATGDPGILNLSAINKGTRFANPLLKSFGAINATNVCGEIPQYPYESCNLGYVNFTKFVKDKKFDFKHLAEVVRIGVRLMDNVIDTSWFPVAEVDKSVRDHRRIGIGCVGWAETLIMLDIAYDSKEAFQLAEKITKHMYKNAFEASCDLAKEKGPFPLVEKSIWSKKDRKPRNVALITFPPSSGNAVICETSYGIEPLFAIAYEHNVLGGERFRNVNKLFLSKLEEYGINSNGIINKIIENNGSLQGLTEIPAEIRRVFRVAHDIHWQDHIRMQAAFQKWTDNAITKTVNMPSSVTPDDIEEAYIMAWKLGCKGLTVYRDRAKKNQVFEFGGSKNGKMKCPACNIDLIKDNKCYKCKKCGFSTCEI